MVPAGQKVVVSWSTAEIKTEVYFSVERSEDGIYFYSIDNVIEVKENLKFSFTDQSSLSGVSYYRLAQYDEGGSALLYKTESVNLDKV